MDQNQTLTPNHIIVGEHLYHEAIGLIIQSATHELLIFDQDLMHGGFSSIATYERLQNFLSQNIASHLSMILQDISYFQNKCPRLLSLLKTYGHKMSVHVTTQSAKHAKDCFILADSKHYIKRIHIDQARFKYAYDDAASVKALKTRFDELKEEIEDVVSITPLGL
jgi:hypothetical protein